MKFKCSVCLLLLVFVQNTSFSQTLTSPKIISVKDGTLVQDVFVGSTSLELTNFEYAFHWHSVSGGNLLDYLASSNVQKQIEFSKDQRDLLHKLKKDLTTGYQEIVAKYPELKDKNLPADERKKINKTVQLKYQELRKDFEKELKDSLVPQQLNLIEQLRFQSALKTFGFTRTITSKPFKEELKTTDEQAKEMNSIKAEAEKAIQKKIQEIREEAKNKMLKVLDAKQRKRLKALEGDSKNKGQIRL